MATTDPKKAISGRAHDDDKWWAAFLLLTAADYVRADMYWKTHAGMMFTKLIESNDSKSVPGSDTEFFYNPSTQRYVRSNGRAVKDDEIRALLIGLLASGADTMESWAGKMVAGEMSLDQWQGVQAQKIKDLYIASYAVGRGGLAQITEDDAKEIIGKKSGDALAGALKKLRRFGKQIESEGETAETPAQIVNRAGLYANPAHTLYEVGRHQAHKNAKDEDGKQILYEESNVLDDQAQHCKTEEHTDGCPEVTDQGWQPFGTLPLPGHRTCGSACRCRMKYRPIENPSPPLTMSETQPITGLILSCGEEYFPAITLGGDFPPQRNGKKCHYYWKDVLPVGMFSDASGRVWDFKPSDIDAILQEHNRSMKLAGHEPSLDERHPTQTDNRRGKNYGWVRGARKNSKGHLELLHQFVGDEEANEALNKKTSILLLQGKRDEHGNKYQWWIDQNAVVSNPRLRNNTLDPEFKPALAASDGQPVDAVYLTAATPEGTVMDLSPLRAALGDAAKDKSDTDVLSLCVTAISDSKTALALSDSQLSDQKEANGVLVGELNKAVSERDAAKQALSLSEEAPEPENPRLIAMGVKSANSDINAAIAEHKINPKQAEYLRGRIKTSPALALADDVGNPSAIDDLIAFASLGADDPQPKNPVVRGRPVEPLKELALSEGEENPSLTAERRKELLGMVGYTVA